MHWVAAEDPAGCVFGVFLRDFAPSVWGVQDCMSRDDGLQVRRCHFKVKRPAPGTLDGTVWMGKAETLPTGVARGSRGRVAP